MRSCHYESEEDAQADLLRNKVYLPPEANGDLSYARQEGDVYSYSIILVEIVTRNGPYGVCLIFHLHTTYLTRLRAT